MVNQAPSIRVAQFFDESGKLISIPARQEKKYAVLQILAQGLDAKKKYAEKELNSFIETFHPDTAAIRRYMIEFKILKRNSESVYWLAEENS